MKKEEVFFSIRMLLAPILVIALGIVLICNPDSASALISKILGWILIVVAVGTGISAIANQAGRIGKIILAVILAVFGGWLVSNPLALAEWIGRIIGIVLILDGIQDIFNLHKTGKSILMPLLITLVGAVLVVMPMTTSRIVFVLCGVVVTVIGVAMLVERLKKSRRQNNAKDDIIDAL